VLPTASRAVQVTRLVPIANAAGALLLKVTVPPQLSVATGGFPRLTLVALQAPLLTFTFTSAGQVVMTGGWLSVTITVWKQVAVFPLASRAIHVTRLVPIANAA